MPRNTQAGRHDPERQLFLLREEVKAAQLRRDQALNLYEDATRRFLTRGPQDGNGLQEAFLAYIRSQQEVLEAFRRVNSYLSRGK